MLVFSRDNTLPNDVTNLLPGSRCILPNTKEYILNNAKVWVPIHAFALEYKTELTTEVLNSIQTQGIYAQPLNAQATIVKNYPTTSAGILTVYVVNGNQIFQQYQVLSGQTDENKVFTRGCYAGVWSPWITPNYLNITQSEWNTVQTNSHTHDQNLNTTDSPLFSGLTLNNTFLKRANLFEVSNLGADSLSSAHFRRISDVASFSKGSDGSTIGDIVISIPVPSSQRWIAIIDMHAFSLGPVELKISAYGTSHSSAKVQIISETPDWITEVKFRRSADDTKTVLIIKRSTGTSTFNYGTVNIREFYHSVTYSPILNDKSYYKVEFLDEATLTDLVGSLSITPKRITTEDWVESEGRTPRGSLYLGTADLNTIITPGFYNQTSDANATLVRNYPVTLAGSLNVIKTVGPNSVVQEYTTYNTGITYKRVAHNNSFSAWKKFTTENELNISNWNTAYGWGNHAGSYLKLSSPGVVQNLNTNPLIIKSTSEENITSFPTGTSYAKVGFNTLNLSGFGLFTELTNPSSSLYWFGITNPTTSVKTKFIEYDSSTDRFKFGIDKSLYFNILTLGTNGNKVLTIDDAGKLSYIDGIPALDANVVHKIGDENIQGIKTFQDKVVQNFTEIPYTNQKLFENVAEYSTNSPSISGNYKITLPIVSAPAVDTNNTMFFMRIYIYNYAGVNEGLTEGTISGYIYRNTYVGLQADFPSSTGISQIRFGHNTNNNPIIFIDDPATKQYSKIILKELQISHTGIIDANWSNKSLWNNAITITTDNTGFTVKNTILASSFKSNLQPITWGAGLTASPLGNYNGKVAQTITPVTGNGTTLGIVKSGIGTTVVTGAINLNFGTIAGTAAEGNDSRFHNALTLGTQNGLSLNTQVLSLALATPSTPGAMSAADKTKLDTIVSGTNGTVTSIGLTMPTGFSVSNSPITSSGSLVVTLTTGYYLPTTSDKANWDAAYAHSLTSHAFLPLDGTSSMLGMITSVKSGRSLYSSATGSFLQVGGDNSGYSGSFGSTGNRGGSLGPNYRTYWAYDAYWDESLDVWKANRTTLGNKLQIEQGYHSGGWRFRSYTGDVTTSWLDEDWVDVVNITRAGVITAASFNRLGGTSTQFLKADGSVDSNTYITTSNAVPYTGATANVDLNSRNLTLNSLIVGDSAGPVLSKGSRNLIGTTQTTLNITKKVFFADGALFNGTALAAGLATRGITGVSAAGDVKDHLYINYDGDNIYNISRQVVLQAGDVGAHYGQNLYQYAAVRGDVVKAWVEANYTTSSNSVPYTGATTNIDINTKTILSNGITFGYGTVNKGFSSATPIAFLNTSSAQQIYTGGVLASNVYTDSSKIPTNGIYSKGNILTTGNFVKEGGLSTQFLKADGSVDNNIYSGRDLSIFSGIRTYSFTNGYLIKTDILESEGVMFELYMSGNAYGSNYPAYDSILTGYQYVPNTTSINALVLLNKGTSITVQAFIFEGVLCFWINPMSAAKSLTFTINTTNTSKKITSVLNVAFPSSGVTKLTSPSVTNSWTDFNLVNPITGPGTTNYIPKFTSGTVLGNSSIFDNGTNVGIGSAAPLAKLQVTTNNAGYIPTIILENKSGAVGSGTGINFSNEVGAGQGQAALAFIRTGSWGVGDLMFLQNGLPNGAAATVSDAVMTIKSGGNVGIGTTTPNAILEVKTPNSSVTGNGIRINRPLATNYAGLEYATNNVVTWSQGVNTDGFGIYEDGQAAKTRLLIQTNGNVGIGTVTPSEKLEVAGNINMFNTFSGGNGGVLNLINNSSTVNSSTELRFAPSASYSVRYSAIRAINNGNNGISLSFITGNGATITEKLIINELGNVGIGTSTPTEKLDVSGNIKSVSFIKVNGLASQFLKADGSVDVNTYSTVSASDIKYVPYTGATTNIDLNNKSITNIDDITGKNLFFATDGPAGTHAYVGFYKWGDEWQVNARNGSNTFVHALFNINTVSKQINAYGNVHTTGSITAGTSIDIQNTDNTSAAPLTISRTSQVGMSFKIGTVNNYLGVSNSGELKFGLNANHGTNNTVWHSGNDGTGSGLDADLLDGKHASEFVTHTQMGSILKAEFVYNGGVQEFLLPNDYYQIFTVDVQGQGALHTTQYTLTVPNKVTITDTLEVGDYVVILYGTGNLAGVPYYTQAETDALIAAVEGNQTVEINSSQPITANKTYRVDASAGNVTLTLINPTSHQTINIKKIDSSVNSVFIKSPQLIDGDDTIELGEQYEKVNLKWCGTTYDII